MIRTALIAMMIPSASLAMCFPPSQPACVTALMPQFEDYDWTMRCSREMDAYEDATRAYKICMEDEMSRIQDQLNSEISLFNRSNEYFVCMLKDQLFCSRP